MKKLLFFLFVTLFAVLPSVETFAQKKKAKKAKQDEIVMPTFLGGEKGLHSFIISEVKYPAEARANKETGEVLVAFSIGVDGHVGSARVLKGVSPSLDAEAIRVVNKMPSWVPGKKNGVPVRAEMTIPINFRMIYEHDKYVADDDEMQKVLDIVF